MDVNDGDPPTLAMLSASTSAQLRETQETLRQVSEKAATLRANLDSTNRSRDLAQADLADAQRELAEVQQALKDTLDDLLATRRALLASQADLTRMERERDEALVMVGRITVKRNDAERERDEARAEVLTLQRPEDAELAITKAELASARTELANLRQWQVARNDDTWCALCGQDIRRGYAIEPVPADKPGDPHRWAHCLCPPSTPNTPRTDAPGNTEGDLPQ